MTPAEMLDWLAERPRILDGAGTGELLQRGVASALRLWGVGALLDAADEVRRLHADYASAGAEAITTLTFRVSPYALRRAGLEDRAGELANLAVRLAIEGARHAGRETVVLASQTTLEDCYRPDLTPGDAVLEREHAATSRLLAAAGAGGLLVETMNTVREARIAAAQAVATGLPVVVSFACRDSGLLLSGEDVGTAAAAASIPGVVAVGANCTALRQLMPALVRIAAVTPLPLVAYANNAWWADDSPWLEAPLASPEQYARCALAWQAAGARLIGGCCGTNPAHIAAVAKVLRPGA